MKFQFDKNKFRMQFDTIRIFFYGLGAVNS